MPCHESVCFFLSFTIHWLVVGGWWPYFRFVDKPNPNVYSQSFIRTLSLQGDRSRVIISISSQGYARLLARLLTSSFIHSFINSACPSNFKLKLEYTKTLDAIIWFETYILYTYIPNTYQIHIKYISNTYISKMQLSHFLLAVLLPTMVKSTVNDPAAAYLSRMCSPLLSDRISKEHFTSDDFVSTLANSPYPCEFVTYMHGICTANGTAAIDFLAEQQCLCNGDFFELLLACGSCAFVHGDTRQTPEMATSSVLSLSMAECTPNPPYQPFSNLLPQPLDVISSESDSSPLTLGVDRFPNNTEISNYYTSTKPLTVGQITGSATARLTSWTNYQGNVYTPSSTPLSSPSTTSPVSSTSITITSIANTVNTASALSTSESTGDAMTQGVVKLPGGFMAVIFVVIVMALSHW